jgi:predicted nucleic acid-binding protein
MIRPAAPARRLDLMTPHFCGIIAARIEKTNHDDLRRTKEILEKYADSQVDFVDCAIVALAERLNVQNILTVDNRHFQLFRPKHRSHFVILP